MGSMLLLIIRPNLIRILLGWDGLGVTSYLLVIYYQRRKSVNAGIITIIRNRVGDVLILLGLGLFLGMGSWNIFVYSLYDWIVENKVFLLIITIAATTKRAQIPFRAWLPAAIAAPTPVSSLVHSSTLVTAGVYLIFRFNQIFFSRGVLMYILVVGGFTMIIAGFRALLEIDIKKVVALSTLRQLGLMIRIIGIGEFNVAYFHLLVHAYFKAILFIRVGRIIHISIDYQDLRKISLYYWRCRLRVGFIVISNLSLMGTPFISGFYSKDLFLEISYISGINFIYLMVLLIRTALTAAYRVRFVIVVLFTENLSFSLNWVKDRDSIIHKSIRGLILLSVFGGRILMWFIFSVPKIIYIPLEWKNLTLLVIIIGRIRGIIRVKFKIISRKVIWLGGTLFSMGAVRRRIIIKEVYLRSSVIKRGLDNFWFPLIIFGGVVNFIIKVFDLMDNIQLKYFVSHLLVIFRGLLVLVLVY